ncbi:MAG: cellulase family glycosylhydrolase [Phycisphaerae bacterium]|nr:cellulase family glycosylhydrolase [Phycisphaerae bacterium]
MRRINALMCLLLAVLCFIGAARAQDAQPRASQERAFIVGACTHFSQGKGILDLNLDRIKRAGISSIRDEVGWGAVEREKGKLAMPEQFDPYVRRAAAQGVDVLLILDYANRFYDDGDRPRSPEAIEGFCRYAEFVVRHFGKTVRLYEIWNEWDISIGMPQQYRKGGSADDYVKLLKAVYPRIKAADPGVTVMAGACTSGGVKKGWLEETVKLGALDSCDAISIHSYNYSDKFPQRGPEACSAWMTGVQEMLRKYKGDDVPFYVTEMGWPTHVGKNGTDPELSASYLARLYLLARTSPSFRGLWWYDFQDDGWKAEYNEDNFGLVRPDLTPKPAYDVLMDISPVVANAQYVDRLPTKDENLWALRFKIGREDCWALWSADDQDRQVILQTKSPPQPVMIQQAGHDMYLTLWGFRDWTDRGAEVVPNRLSIVVGPRPCLIGNDLSTVSVVDVIARPRQAAVTPPQ